MQDKWVTLSICAFTLFVHPTYAAYGEWLESRWLVVLTAALSPWHPPTMSELISKGYPEFFITVDFLGTWTEPRKDVFQSAANRYVCPLALSVSRSSMLVEARIHG